MRQRTKHPATELTGSRLKLLRENAGFTRRELANLSKIDFTYIKKIELGISDPNAELNFIMRIRCSLV